MVGAVVELDPKLFNKAPPRDTPFAPFAAAKLGQFWVAAAGWAEPGKPAALLLGPEPVIATPPRTAKPGDRLNVEVTAPMVGHLDQPGSADRWSAALEHAAPYSIEE